MRRYLFSLALITLALPVFAADYPFEGQWDCEVAVFSFTKSTYNNGSEDLPIRKITPEADGYMLSFAGDYELALIVNPDGTLYWFSPASGDSFTCARLG